MLFCIFCMMEKQGGMGISCYGAHGSSWRKSGTKTRRSQKNKREGDGKFFQWAKKSKKMILTRDRSSSACFMWCSNGWFKICAEEEQLCCDIASLPYIEGSTCSAFLLLSEDWCQWCILPWPTREEERMMKSGTLHKLLLLCIIGVNLILFAGAWLSVACCTLRWKARSTA